MSIKTLNILLVILLFVNSVFVGINIGQNDVDWSTYLSAGAAALCGYALLKDVNK